MPSASFGNMTPTFLLLGTCFHSERYNPANCAPPKAKWYVHLKGEGCPGFPPRPKYQASQGITVERQGTPAASQASATGFTTSGVEVTSIKSILSSLMRDLASWPARAGSD